MNLEKTADRLRRKLSAQFTPIQLEISDESARHVGHAGYRERGETHFHVAIVSVAFAGQSKVARHRAVYAVLAEEMQEDGIHALALDLKTPDEI
jgi:BolA protein